MKSTVIAASRPRKTPVQERAAVTVDAILEATSQVLIQSGLDRFSTDRVAKRAGVSIGTLYQYFPNKQSLVYKLLQRYFDARDEALEETCRLLGGSPVETLIPGIVNTYVDSKLGHIALAASLYAAAIETGAAAIVKQTSDRCAKALSEALAISTGHPVSETHFPAVMLFTLWHKRLGVCWSFAEHLSRLQTFANISHCCAALMCRRGCRRRPVCNLTWPE